MKHPGWTHEFIAQVAQIPQSSEIWVEARIDAREPVRRTMRDGFPDRFIPRHEIVIRHPVPVLMLFIRPILKRQSGVGGGLTRKSAPVQVGWMVLPAISVQEWKPLFRHHPVEMRGVDISAGE